MYCRVKLGPSTGWSPGVEGEGGDVEREGVAKAEREGEGEGKVEVEGKGKAWGQGRGRGRGRERGRGRRELHWDLCEACSAVLLFLHSSTFSYSYSCS